MRKIPAVLLLLTFILTSCNFPLAKTPDSASLIATKVAETLAAAETAVIPTLQSTDLNELPAPSETPTLTPEPTLTPTATATAPASDPALSLGAPSFKDTFDNGVSFGLASPYEDSVITIKVENGSMVFKSQAIKGGRRWRLTSRDPKNLYLEGTFKTVSCSGMDHYGLVFRSPTYTDGIGYYFGVNCNGQYNFVRWDASGSTTLINWTAEPKLQSGINQVNRIGVMATNDSFRLYANGNLIKEFTDTGIINKGFIGAFASAVEDPGFTVNLDQISLWNLP